MRRSRRDQLSNDDPGSQPQNRGSFEASSDSAREDVAIATGVCAGDTGAFTRLFNKYYAALLRFVIRYLASRDAAEDVVQDLFTRIWDIRAHLDPSKSLRSYLFTTARNSALKVLEHDAVVQQHVAQTGVRHADDLDAPMAPAADAIMLADELARVAEARVALLSPRLREVYHLSRIDGLLPKEIAEMLGTSVATVHVQMAKIVQALYPAVEQWVKE